MTARRAWTAIAVVAVLLGLTAVDARAAGAVVPVPAKVLPSWPPPPAPARIRFVRSLMPAAMRGKRSLLGRVWGFIAGDPVDPTMSQPYAVAVGPDRRVYVADTSGGVVHIYNVEKPGYSSMRVDAGSLVGIAFIGERMVLTDSASGRVLCVDKKGHTIWTLGPKDGFARPTGVAAGPYGAYIVDTIKNRVVSVSSDGVVLSSFGERGAEPGQFNFPTHITRTPDGTLFVTDSLNFRIQAFDPEGHPKSAFGRLGDGSGDLDKPKGVAVDRDGHIYVVEGLNDVVQIFDTQGRLLLVFGGSGAGDGELWLPAGITIAADRVYVADSANRRVQVFDYVKEIR